MRRITIVKNTCIANFTADGVHHCC
jgi:hypothetical protein